MPADRPSEEQNGNDAQKSSSASPNAAKSETPEEREKRRAARRRKRTIKRWARGIGITIVLLAAAAMLGVALTIQHYDSDLPSTQELKSYRPPQVTRVMARDGQVVLGELFVERRTIVDIESLPAHVRYVALAAEDAAFYEHKGLDYPGLLRALYKNLRNAKAKQGASTITQQVVKNVLLNDPSRTYKRKLKEVVLARRLEQDLTKDEILELYLNHIYLGGGRYGVEEASRYHFGKSVRDLTIAEGALLGGLTAGPELFAPRNDLARATTRRAFVLDQMERKGFLDHARAEQAKNEPIRSVPAAMLVSPSAALNRRNSAILAVMLGSMASISTMSGVSKAWPMATGSPGP